MSDKRRMYYVGFCRICGTGPLGLRECGGCGELVVLCDECDAVWSDENFAAKPQFANDGELPCPHCQESLIEQPSCWASAAKIQQSKWVQEALEAGILELQRGAALSPEIDADDLDHGTGF